MRRLIPVVLLTIGLLASTAWAQAAGPSASRPGVHRHAPAPKSKTAARTAKTRAPRHTVRKAHAARTVTKAQRPVHRAPVKRAVVTEVTLV